MSKLKQGERIYFRISETVEGYATVAGDYDLLVIIKPETPVGAYSHIYVTKAQIVEPPRTAPVVPEDNDDLPFRTGHEPPPDGQATF